MKRSLQSRVLLLVVALVAIGQFPTFLAVDYVIKRNVIVRAEHDLDAGVKVVRRLLDSRGQQLADTVQVAAGDFAFREAVATRDERTIQSVLINHGNRINASFVALVAPDGDVMDSTTDLIDVGAPYPFTSLLETARTDKPVPTVAALRNQPFQVVLADVRAPLRIGWVSMGFALDRSVLEQFHELSGLEVSLVSVGDRTPPPIVSTLPDDVRPLLASSLKSGGENDAAPLSAMDGYLTRAVPLSRNGSGLAVWLIMQTSTAQALAPYGALKGHLTLIALASVLLSIVGAWLLARQVTEPVRKLVVAARRVGKGDYLDPVNVDRHDEIGELAKVFNTMQVGIAERERHIAHQAFHDALTGLPNRASIERQLDEAVKRAADQRGHVAVMMIDVDRFKDINDTMGHAIGDELLVALGQRLRAAARPADAVGRFGGDEFVIVSAGLDLAGANGLADAIVRAVSQSLRLNAIDLFPEISMGVAIYPEHGVTGSDLLRRADIAMYEAKQARAPVASYSHGSDATYLRRLSLVNDLRRAIGNDELRLHYQPKIEIGNEWPTHVEALVRWQHPVEGLLGPDEFIPLAEHAGSIHLVTQWVLRHVLQQCREWDNAGFSLGVAVNLSAMDLAVDNLPGIVNALLVEFGVPPERLLLEITESAIMRDAEYALDVLTRLKALGVRLAIDDFGTGYSSLAHLKRLPVDELKIDKSFVLSMTHDSDDAIIVRSTIELGHNMGLSVVAEGVEAPAALAMLKDYRCDMAQGYLISRPLAATDLTAWLVDRSAAATLAACRAAEANGE